MKVGDIVRIAEKNEGKRISAYRYVVVAVSPTNNLVKGRVDLVMLENVQTPLQTRGVGMPTKYLKKMGRLSKQDCPSTICYNDYGAGRD